MVELKESANLPAELTVEILIRGALALEQGESGKVFRGLKRGLEKLIAQKTISNRAAQEFKRLWKKLEEDAMREKIIQEMIVEVEKNFSCYYCGKKELVFLSMDDMPPLEKQGLLQEEKAWFQCQACGKKEKKNLTYPHTNNGWHTTEDQAGWEMLRQALQAAVADNPKASPKEIFSLVMPVITALAAEKVRSGGNPAADLAQHRAGMAEIVRQYCDSFPVPQEEGVAHVTSEYSFWATFERRWFGKCTPLTEERTRPETWKGMHFTHRMTRVSLEEVFSGYIP